MLAVVLSDHGGPEVLRLQEVADPVPGPEEVLVAVRATALNRADLLQRLGRYPGPPAAVEIPGMEFSGVVAEVGSRCTERSVGDEVMGIVGGGAYAQRLVVHERQVLPVPASVGVADGAAIPEVFITAFDALVAQGGLTAGATALIHAGGSGVGTAGIQVCKRMGAGVMVTASASKVERCRDLGADLAIDYGARDFVEEVRNASAGRGVDVILDVVGGEYLERNLSCLALQGTIVQVGVMDPTPPRLNLGRLLSARATLIGTVLRARPIEEKIAITRRFGNEVLGGFDDGTLRPVVDRRYELAEIGEAHRYMETNANFGKILIDV